MPSLPFAVIPERVSSFTAAAGTSWSYPEHLAEFQHIGMVTNIDPVPTGGTLALEALLPNARPVDFCSLLQASVPSTAQIRLRLYAGATEIYDSGVAPFILPTITRPDRLYSSHQEFAAVTPTRLRIELSGLGNTRFAIGKLVIGKRVTPATFYNPGFEFGVEDRGSLEIGRFGVVENTPGVILRALKLKFGWLSELDFETKFRPLDEALGERGIALWCFDPTPNAYRQARTYFGWLRDPPYATGGVNNTRYEKDYSILSVI